MQCKLCLEQTSAQKLEAHGREFFCCENCGYVQVNPQQILSILEEEKRYQLHENALGDPRYEEFLCPMVDLVEAHVPSQAKGIDIGSGKEKVMESLLRSRGRMLVSYDLYFHADERLLKNSYDYLVCSETLEHFRDPREELKRFGVLVKKGGKLFFRTSFFSHERKFSDWHYQRDPTHIGFFAKETFEWMEKEFGWKLLILKDPFVVFEL